MKQINLNLAKSGDVAVLRNGEKIEIIDVKPNKAKHDAVRVMVNHPKVVAIHAKIDGSHGINQPHRFDILDILRGGVSIFEPK